MMKKDKKIAIIGLGYVGLPLARLFATKYLVVGFDIKPNRVSELKKGLDATLEVEKEILNEVLVNAVNEKKGLFCTSNLRDIENCNYYIITVPTPVDKNNKPDLTLLIKASETVGSVIKKGAIVIYESTVYPGATEEICVPVLEEKSNLVFNKDFYVGYSPERINPGDKKHTVEKILKVTSGSTKKVGEEVNSLYASVITAGTHLAPTIKVAEAAKVIENSQRDINIAFVNELAKIFNLLNIDTQAVLEAAGTKWNFLPFKPGLVGGHCIGVDPYYLAQKAQEAGYHPEIILAGRRMNDSMGQYVASEVIKLMIQKDIKVKGANLLVLGITFKENCPDVRNTKVVDVVHELKQFGTKVTIFDPWANPEEVMQEYGLRCHTELVEVRHAKLIETRHPQLIETRHPQLGWGSANEMVIVSETRQSHKQNEKPAIVTLSLSTALKTGLIEGQLPSTKYDAIVLTVAHNEFLKLDLTSFLRDNGIIYDVKGVLKGKVQGRL